MSQWSGAAAIATTRSNLGWVAAFAQDTFSRFWSGPVLGASDPF